MLITPDIKSSLKLMNTTIREAFTLKPHVDWGTLMYLCNSTTSHYFIFLSNVSISTSSARQYPSAYGLFINLCHRGLYLALAHVVSIIW